MPVIMSPFNNSGIDTKGTIQKLVDLERRPIIRKQSEIKRQQIKKITWGELRIQLKKLDGLIAELYGFNRVFKKRKVFSGDEGVLKASVLDNTGKGEHTIDIMQLAAAHKIITDRIPTDRSLPGAVFTIQIGDDEENKIEVKGFKNGGTINKLTKILIDEADKLIIVQKINVDKDNSVMSIESRKTGKNSRIKISGKDNKSKKLFKELGMVKFEKPVSIKYDFNDNKPENLRFYKKGYKDSPALFLQSKEKQTIRIGEEINQGVVEFVYSSIKPEKKQISGNDTIQKNIGSVQIKDIIIFGADMIMNNMKLSPSTENKEGAYMEIVDKKSNKLRIDMEVNKNWKEQKTELKDLSYIERINFINNSPENYLIDNLKIFDWKDEKRIYKNIVQNPNDAEIKVNGVTMTRENNRDLNDILDGVTLNLMKKSDGPIKIEITEDIEKIEKTLDDFVNQYNLVLEFITKSGKSSRTGKPGDPGMDSGILSNDIALMNLKSKLRSTVVNSYITSYKNRLSMLAQIGISTGGWRSKWESIRKGLLIFDKEKFNSALNAFGDKISELFGYDTNRDLLIDTGIGFSLNKIIAPYTQGGGIIKGKENTIDNTIKSKKKVINRKTEDLEDYEDSPRRKFLKMEHYMDNLNQNQKQLDGQMKSLPSKNKE